MQAQLTREKAVKDHTMGDPTAIDRRLHPEIRSLVQLDSDLRKKIYFSGPLKRHVARKPDGSPSENKEWTDMWGQLGGVVLSLWDSKEIEAASGRGEEVPPTYINVTDAFVHVLGSVTVPATATTPAKKFAQVITLNTAGSNLLLFSCPSPAEVVSWAAAIRMAAWEKSRLEEIYTGHILRLASFASHSTWMNPPSPLQRGRMEGWVRIRLACHVEWKRVWLVVQSNIVSASKDSSAAGQRKNPMSILFPRTRTAPPLPTKSQLTFYSTSKPKDTKKAILTFTDLTQAFAVYPEKPELITRSSLIKLEGTIGEEDFAGEMKGREGWVLVMVGLGSNPEEQKTGHTLKWLTGIHDAFGMYGRPSRYEWDPRNEESVFFVYPFGPHRDNLFLSRELGENDPREDRTSVIRDAFKTTLIHRLQGHGLTAETVQATEAHDPLPPISEMTLASRPSNNFKLPEPITDRIQSENPRGGTPAGVSSMGGNPRGGTELPPYSYHDHYLAKPPSDEEIRSAQESSIAGQKSQTSVEDDEHKFTFDHISGEFDPLALARRPDDDSEDPKRRMNSGDVDSLRRDSFGASEMMTSMSHVDGAGGHAIQTYDGPVHDVAKTADSPRASAGLSWSQIYRNRVVEMLDKSLGLQSPQDAWRDVRDRMKLCPFSVHYSLKFIQEQGNYPEFLSHVHGLQFYSQVEEWMTWDLTKSLVRYRDIIETILELHEKLTTSRLTETKFLQWSTVFRAAIVNDVDDMCATLPTATRSGKCESLITLNLDELHEIMNVVQMFVDERCIFRTQFERFLKKVVRTRDILPPYLFIPGVQKIGTNAVGGGGFADVWRGELEGKPVALKVLRIFGPQTECAKIFKEFSKEAMIWRQFDHPNILPFHGCCRDLFTPLYAFISPWMENGDMVSFLKQNPNADRLAMVRGVASGLCYLHNLRPQVIHGDLRGSNVLIDENKLPRIADFGLATVADTQAISLATVSYNGKGSLRWQAPELLSFSKEATESVKTTDGSDVYAFACLCLEVFTDRPPFSGLSDGTVIAALLIHDERPARPLAPAAERGLDDEMWDLMQNCWATRRSERPRMKAVYERIRPYTPSEDRRDDREPFTSQATSDRRRVFDLPEECFKPEIQRYRLGVKPSDLS